MNRFLDWCMDGGTGRFILGLGAICGATCLALWLLCDLPGRIIEAVMAS